MTDEPHINVRLRTASDRKKQLAQYDELRRSGLMVRSVIIAEMKNGAMQILGQGMSLAEIGRSLMTAAGALVEAEKKRDETRLRPEEPADQLIGREVARAGPAIAPTLETGDDGALQAPEGEAFITCGECSHTRWFVLARVDAEPITRLACSRCGNEIMMRRVDHEAGHA